MVFSLMNWSSFTIRELANALMEGMEEDTDRSGGSQDGLSASEDEDDDEDNDGGDPGDGTEDEDDEETTEKKAKIKQFTSEIKALESAIEKKRAGFTKGNIIMEVSGPIYGMINADSL